MKRKNIAIVACVLILLVGVAGIAIAEARGPAPNSGDCIPDGSGFDSSNGPAGNSESGRGHGGPAPNSGDCIPDGPGW